MQTGSWFTIFSLIGTVLAFWFIGWCGRQFLDEEAENSQRESFLLEKSQRESILLESIFHLDGLPGQKDAGKKTGTELKTLQKRAENGETWAQNKLARQYCYRAMGDTQNLSKALKWYQKAAEREDTVAQTAIGSMYALGLGVLQNHNKAVKWHRKAAEQGYSEAQFLLASAYENGIGTHRDYNKATKWYREAAEQGNTDALQNLLMIYYEVDGIPQDYRKAAGRGDAAAQLVLGLMYHRGEGVPQNQVEAHKWFNLAADKYKGAATLRDALAQEMTKEDIARAQKLAQEWLDEYEE